MADGWGVDSEFKPLRRVIVHSPSHKELRLAGRDPKAYLFLEAPRVDEAIRQHRRLVDILESEGVDVINLPSFTGEIKPNLMYTRDLGVLTSKGAIICNVTSSVRRGEEEVVRRFLLEEDIPILFDVGEAYPKVHFEGGDFVYLDSDLATVGETERTRLPAHLILAQLGMVRRIIPVFLPADFIHLDLVFTIVGDHMALVYPAVLPYRFLSDLKAFGMNFVEIEWRELGSLAANVLAIKPGKVVAASKNRVTNAKLRREGIDVIEIEIDELLKGNGGPRCLTLPLERR